MDLLKPKWITCFWQTALENMSSILQIFSHSKFHNHQTTGSKVMAKKLAFIEQKVNFLDRTFEPVVRFSPNVEREKIFTMHGLFAEAVC